MPDDENRSFSSILADFHTNLDSLPEGVSIPDNTWVYEAAAISDEFFGYFDVHGAAETDAAFSDDYVYKVKMSISLIDELNKVLKINELLNETSHENYVRRINVLLDSRVMPLLPEDEDAASNEGRNTLFELRLLNRFMKAGYLVDLPREPNPDLKFFTNDRVYSVECKRILSTRKFRKNIVAAITQLTDNSLRADNELGVVAINISRFFNINSNKRFFTASSREEANFKIKQDYLRFKDETIASYRTISFPIKIPLIIFEYSEFGFVGDQLKSISYTDFSDSQAHSNGFSLFQAITPDLRPLFREFSRLS